MFFFLDKNENGKYFCRIVYKDLDFFKTSHKKNFNVRGSCRLRSNTLTIMLNKIVHDQKNFIQFTRFP